MKSDLIVILQDIPILVQETCVLASLRIEGFESFIEAEAQILVGPIRNRWTRPSIDKMANGSCRLVSIASDGPV